MFAYFNDGLSFRAVSDDYIAEQGEKLFPDYATPEQLAASFPNYSAAKNAEQVKIENAAIILKIEELEKKGLRAMRDNALGIDSTARLRDIDNQIKVLRSQLKIN